jgi:hypothetical protein
MNNLECPVCGSSNIQTEKRPDGFHHCMNCRYSWEIGAKQLKQTVFESITASPEALAPHLVFWEGGWTSRFIKFTTTNQEEAIAATVEKLKEVGNDLSGMYIRRDQTRRA